MINSIPAMVTHRFGKCKTEHVWHEDDDDYKTLTNSITYKHCHHLSDPYAKPLIPLKIVLKQAESRLTGECPECDQLIDSRKNLHAMWCSKAEFKVTINNGCNGNILYYKDQIR